jgi:hypothetical protein
VFLAGCMRRKESVDEGEDQVREGMGRREEKMR